MPQHHAVDIWNGVVGANDAAVLVGNAYVPAQVASRARVSEARDFNVVHGHVALPRLELNVSELIGSISHPSDIVHRHQAKVGTPAAAIQ